MIRKKMLQIMRELGDIPKDARNQQQGFSYRSFDSIVSAVRPLMLKHGVIMTSRTVDIQFGNPIQTKNGGNTHVAVTVEYQFFDAQSDEDAEIAEPPISVVTVGEGADSYDKAVKKAITGSLSVALQHAFLISTGDREAEVEHGNQSWGGQSQRTQQPRSQGQQQSQQSQQSQRPQQQQDGGDGESGEVAITEITFKDKVGNNGPYKLFRIVDSEGSEYSTFSEDIANAAKQAKESGAAVVVRYETNRFGKRASDILEVSYDTEEEPEDGENIPF